MTDSPTPAPEVVSQPEAQEAPATVTFVEDANTGAIDEAPTQSHPDAITMQPEDPAPVTQEGNDQPAPAPTPEPVAPRLSGAPKVEEINAEMAAGAARVQEHENRERMLSSKRASDVPEEQQVSDATAANKDL